jgi:hypothetical protein
MHTVNGYTEWTNQVNITLLVIPPLALNRMTNIPDFAAPTPHAATLPEDIDEESQGKRRAPKSQRTGTRVAPEERSNSMEVDASSMSTTPREVHATFFGPIPWKVTANILQTQLYISTWTNVDLPTIVQQNSDKLNNIGIYLGNGFKVKGQHNQAEAEQSWNRGQSHEKIGIALRKSDENKYWTCIADGNHRTSEISHAGATICLSSENLWNAVSSGLKKENGAEYFSTGAVSEGIEDVTLDITLRAETQLTYRNQFRWHISSIDPSPADKTNGVLGLSYASSSSSGGATRSNAMDVDDPTKREPPKLKKRPNSDVEKREDDGDNETNTLPPKAKKSKKRER